MKLKYRQYQWNSEYKNKEMEIPEDTHIYRVYCCSMNYKVKDKEDTMTDGYLFKSDRQFSGSCYIGNAWYCYKEHIYMEESLIPIEPIENCTPPKNCYIVYEQHNLKATSTPLYIDGKIVDCDLDTLRKYSKEIAFIAKIRRFTAHGIETAVVSMKSMSSEDEIEARILTFAYNRRYDGIGTPFFSTKKEYRKLFNDKLKEYYKLFKE